MRYNDALLERWCQEEELNYQLASKLKAKIFPLLEEAHRKLGYRFNKVLIEHRKGTDLRLANSKTILLLMKKLKPQNFPIKERKAITLHLEYMTLVEGLFAPQINFLIYILIANGHNFCIPRKRDYAKTLSDIEKVSLRSRVKFLAKHGFRKLITEKVDIGLRNSIAHLFYEIDEKGTLKVGERPISEEYYVKLYNDLRNVGSSLNLINKLYYDIACMIWERERGGV